ncbi:MAG: hypothetical protein ACYDHM_00645 [Acidiferrobacterales bacterium]
MRNTKYVLGALLRGRHPGPPATGARQWLQRRWRRAAAACGAHSSSGWGAIEALDEAALEALRYPEIAKKCDTQGRARPLPDWVKVHEELSRRARHKLLHLRASHFVPGPASVARLPCAFGYFQGVSAITVPDHVAAEVKRADRYEAEATESYLELARHFGTCFNPVRVRKFRDKAKVEAACLVAQRWGSWRNCGTARSIT